MLKYRKKVVLEFIILQKMIIFAAHEAPFRDENTKAITVCPDHFPYSAADGGPNRFCDHQAFGERYVPILRYIRE
jgi:hypothetical protein